MERDLLMLKEIICDSFSPTYRKIVLNHGLNIVQGTENASNSIGKSTFLMILDFIFGGDDYINLLDDVQDEVGPHSIKFMFDFKGEQYRFARSTNDKNNIVCCSGEDYLPDGTSKTLTEYRVFLEKHYSLYNEGQTLRNTVSRFIRVYPRDAIMDRKHPLSENRHQSDKNAIDDLLKVMGLYSQIKEKQDLSNECGAKLNAFKAAQKYRFIPTIDGEENLEELIDRLENKRRRLLDETSFGMTDIESIKESRLAELQIKQSQLKREKTALQLKIETVKLNRTNAEQRGKKEYDALKRYFPSVDIAEIEKIDEFHNKLISILQNDVSSYEIGLREEIKSIDAAIEEVENEFEDIAKEDNTSKIILKDFAETDNNLKYFKMMKKNEKVKEELAKEKGEAEKAYNDLLLNTTFEFVKLLNSQMGKINDIIYNGKKTQPYLTIDKSSKYTFTNPKDGGSGTSYRGVIVFDIAMSHLATLPIIVHDSDMLKLIEDEAVENILKVYKNAGCQVFIAIDKKSTYPEEAQKIIEDSTILKLASESGALFGRTWNTKESTQKKK